MRTLRNFIAAFVSAWLLAGPVSVGAMTVSVYPPAPDVTVGSDFEVSLFFDTQGESINAISGTLEYPMDLLELRDAGDGNSAVSFWIEHPSPKDPNFAGMIPGGFRGSRGLLLTLEFRAKKAGKGKISVSNLEAHRNDATGSPAKVSIAPASVTVGEGEVQPMPQAVDNEPPSAFTPTVGRDPNIYNGLSFVVFATTDKGSGIDHYEVKESGADWALATSPYVLHDQTLQSDVEVKALDRAGNARIEKVSGAMHWLPYAVAAGLAILVALAFGYALWRRSRKSRRRK